MDEISRQWLETIEQSGPEGIQLKELQKRFPGFRMSPAEMEMIFRGEVRYFPMNSQPPGPPPMFVQKPRNNRSVIFLARFKNRFGTPRERVLFLAVSLAFVAGVIIGAAFF